MYACGAKPGDYDRFRSFLLIYFCQNVSVCFCFRFGKELRHFSAKEISKKVDFLCESEALKVFRKYRCHPVVGFKVFRIIIDIIMLIEGYRYGSGSIPLTSGSGSGRPKTRGSGGSGIGPGTMLPLNSFVGKSSQINLQTSI